MCLQPSLPFVVVTNCSTQALFREGCSRACLTCRCYWVPAQVCSRQLESHAEQLWLLRTLCVVSFTTQESFYCILIAMQYGVHDVYRPLCELHSGRQGYRENYEQVKCDSWPLRTEKQSSLYCGPDWRKTWGHNVNLHPDALEKNSDVPFHQHQLLRPICRIPPASGLLLRYHKQSGYVAWHHAHSAPSGLQCTLCHSSAGGLCTLMRAKPCSSRGGGDIICLLQ